MKYEITVIFNEHRWNGNFEEIHKEHSLFEEYLDWCAGNVILRDVLEYLKDWDENTVTDSDTYAGDFFYAHCEFGSEIKDVVKKTIERKMDYFRKNHPSFKKCPIDEVGFEVQIFED